MMTKQSYRKLALMRVFVFSLSAFIFNTTEFVPVALLSDIALSFEMETAIVGLMITVYAWMVFLGSLPLMLLTAKVERKKLLLLIFALFIVSHILSVVAWNFWVLLISRIGIALAHAIFWSITASLVIRVAPKDKKQQALGLLALGSSLAMILGLPLGRMIGQVLDWRSTFAVIGVIATLVILLMWKLLPYLPSKNAGSLVSLPILAKRPLLIGIYLLVMMIISGHFTTYSYIEPFAIKISQFTSEIATMMLFIFGLAGIAGSFLFGRLYAKNPRKFIACAMLLVIVPQLLLFPLKHVEMAIFLLVFLWGIGITSLSIALQMCVLELAPDATDVATAIYSGIYNVGIGAGALFGSIVIHQLGLEYVGLIGGGLGLLALIWLGIMTIKFGKKA
ncbi:sugar transporter [Haemophilus paraphrohaemolyticus]|uniref:Probable sugar efflux transporter n=1 Tax=Haemophilus paraphrohaemolyticus HK411 TaxID=1095743 RepID=I2NJ06_9PAST|nr:sugar transporter [Haemophilus paraphrohaemolyticus]EIG25817.1 sugar efflux transporter [Haemophilus paraphrohaemolyticus HK411]STP01640.1 Sugar efflux transporter B [Haemophilus paraphrohaemolyticus]